MKTVRFDKPTAPASATATVETMTAIVHDEYGTAPEDVLRLAKVDKPTIRDDEVLVRVHAASVDRGTWHVMAGLPYPVRVAGFGLRKPKYLNPGRSLAGTVDAVGAEVTSFEPGDEVFGICDGSFAEYVRVGTDKLAPKPSSLSFDEAAALPISALTALTAPADLAVMTTKQPTLNVGAVTDPDGDVVQYEFSIATGADGRSGMVATSGWIGSTSWTVPVGVLKDGVTYTWTARTRDRDQDTQSLDAASRRMKVDMRLGAQGPVPGDAVGPITVNLSTGNVITGMSTPSMNTVGGPISISMTYNSLAVDEAGLVGAYFAGDSATGIVDTESPVLVRTDPQVSFDWGDTSPYPPVLSKDAFRIRWQGFVTAPVTGSYVFGGQHDGGMRIWVGNDQVYDAWLVAMAGNAPPRFDGAVPKQLTAGTAYPIRVEMHEGGFAAFTKLWAKKDVDAPVPVPSSWLSPTARALPPGWSMSADVDGAGGGYTKATLTDGGVTLTDSTGASHGYTKLSDGGYAPPPGEYGTLSRDETGRLTLIDSDGTAYEFNAAGGLVSITSPADARQPAAARMEWSTLDAANPVPRLTRITDPVSNRAITLHYAGDAECGPFGVYEPPPPGHLCAVKLPDGAKTTLYYRQGGKLERFINPGSEATDLGYTANHLVNSLRTPLALDWITADVANRNVWGPNHLLGYDANRRASWVKAPEPSGFDQNPSQHPRHDYTYGPDWTEIDIAGIAPVSGYARRITRDAGGRMLTDTDATGKTTSYEWDFADKQLSVTDPAGRKSAAVYDAKEDPIDAYGPAPSNYFGADRRPLPSPPAGCDKIPHTATRYDEGMTGLAGTWWTNPNMTGAVHTVSTAAPNVSWGTTRRADLRRRQSPRQPHLSTDRAGLSTGRVLAARRRVQQFDRAGCVRRRAQWDLLGTVTRGAAGAMPDDNDTAADFPDGRATVPDADALDITGPLTIEAWVKPRHHAGGWHDLISKYAGSDTANLPLELAINPDFKLEFRQGSGGVAFDRKLSTHAVVPNAWNHIAVTRDGANKVTFFINGAKSGEVTMSRAAGANSTPLAIGRRPAGGQAQAWLDEVAIYNAALAEKDIDRHIAAAGVVNQSRKSINLAAGTHRFRLEYIHRALVGNQTRGASGVNLTWILGTNPWAAVPADKLTPDYGLATSTTEHESDGVPDQTVAARYTDNGWDPAYGVATSAVADPAGLGLTTRTAFEQPGTGFPTPSHQDHAHRGTDQLRPLRQHRNS